MIMRIKIIRSNNRYTKGDIIEVSPNVGFGLIDSGFAIVSKDITQRDIKVKEEDAAIQLYSVRKRVQKSTKRQK